MRKSWIWGIILTLALCLTLLPATAAAEWPEYEVGSVDDYTAAVAQIESQTEAEATIVLTGNISLPDGTLGVSVKKITVVSEGSSNYTIESSNQSKIYLLGDTTFQNVKPKGSLFAQGHTVEFGEEYTGTELRLYGGSDVDLDLTTNGDEDGSTHIIIRSGKFHSIVGGNKDTFDQGEYHEYADWSDPETNKHTTLTGDVLIDIYGGSWGGSYNIDVGDTCCNTDVTPTRLYGGGLGSDTIGDITINVYGMDVSSGYNDIIMGGGFGMAGGENDTTLYNNAIKHTGIVDGSINLNLLGGNVAEFYGGGYHGGSAYKPKWSVSTERDGQRAYHRDEVAYVTGDVNIVMGGDMALCQSTAQAWGGSYSSTIRGDINVTIKDKAKLAANYSMNNGGAPTPETMNELVKTYAQYYDGMYGGSGWDNGFYGTGQYDIVYGSVNINVEGGYIWELYGTTWTNIFTSLDNVENTEIRNEDNAPAGININISGGMIQKLWGDYYGGKIADGIAVTMTGGEVFVLNAYDGRNSSLGSGSHVDVSMSGGTIYGLTGNFFKMPDGVTASLTLDSATAGQDGTLYVGYIEGFHSITVKENANVRIDGVPVIQTIFDMPEGSYGEDADQPFYDNVYDLNIEENATLTTCKNATSILGSLTNSNGTWIANGAVDIGRNADSNGGRIFFKEPSRIQGDAAWDGTLLCLPVVAEGENYDGDTNTDIALTVGGASSGKASVRTVEKEDHTQAKAPALGDNYVLSQKDGDEPAQAVYVLENSDAVALGYFLERKDDLNTSANNYMWQVAKGEPPAETITITPASITIYMGGTGYAGAVDGSGGIIGTGSGFPEPGFLLTLPDSVKDVSLLKLVYTDGETEYQWKFEKYGEGANNLYRIVPDSGTQQRSVRMQFTTEDGTVVSDDGFEFDEYLNQTLTMKVYGEGIDEGKVSFLYDGKTTYAIAVGEDATLTVRGTTKNAVYSPVNAAEPEEGAPRLEAEEGTVYYINGGNVQVADADGVALLFDDIIETDGEDTNKGLLRERALDELGEGEWSFEYKYLDLVDTANGNAWVKASEDVTVYWPKPENAPADAEFTLLHFEGLDREMGTDNIGSNIAECEVQQPDVTLSEDGEYLVFTVEPGGFSPFVLAWASPEPVYVPPLLNTYDHYGYMVGYEDGTVRPNASITRAETATIFFRLLTDEARAQYWTEANDYADVNAGDWYNNAVSTLSNMGILGGYEDGAFRPNATVTRAEFAKIAVSFFEYEDIAAENIFTDVVPGSWYESCVAAAAKIGLIEGYEDGTFRPDAGITRAEACAIVNRTLSRVPEKDHLLPESEMNVWPDNTPEAWYYADIQEATNSHEYKRLGNIEQWLKKLPEKNWDELEY